jgi:hypothetical protein
MENELHDYLADVDVQVENQRNNIIKYIRYATILNYKTLKLPISKWSDKTVRRIQKGKYDRQFRRAFKQKCPTKPPDPMKVVFENLFSSFKSKCGHSIFRMLMNKVDVAGMLNRAVGFDNNNNNSNNKHPEYPQHILMYMVVMVYPMYIIILRCHHHNNLVPFQNITIDRLVIIVPLQRLHNLLLHNLHTIIILMIPIHHLHTLIHLINLTAVVIITTTTMPLLLLQIILLTTTATTTMVLLRNESVNLWYVIKLSECITRK